MTEDSSTTPMALEGVRVLDLSRVLAGPWCTQTLADLGADVIKVERPARDGDPGGDDTRGWGPPFLRDADGAETADAAYYARHQPQQALGDDRHRHGRRFGASAHTRRQGDVLVENFKVGDLARRGLDAATLLARNPRLVYCSITGFGQTGPYRERAGYDYAIQGMGGLMSVTGPSRAEIADDASGGGPQKVGVAVADLFTGMYAVTAILAALRHRDRTGRGQAIDMALLDTQVAMLANLGAGYLASGVAPQRAGNAHQSIVPYQVFEVADGHLILAVGNDAQFGRFCAVAGCPELAADPRFARNAGPGARSRRLGAAAGGAPQAAPARRLARRSRGRQGAVRADQRPRRGLRRPAGARARDDRRDAAPAGRHRPPGRQPDQARGDAGALPAGAAAARRGHRRGPGRARPGRRRDRRPAPPGRDLRRRAAISEQVVTFVDFVDSTGQPAPPTLAPRPAAIDTRGWPAAQGEALLARPGRDPGGRRRRTLGVPARLRPACLFENVSPCPPALDPSPTSPSMIRPAPDDDQRWHDLVSQVGVEIAEPLTAALERIHVLTATGKIDRAGLRALRDEVEQARQAGMIGQQLTRFASGRVRQSHEVLQLEEVLKSVLSLRTRETQARGIALKHELKSARVIVDGSLLFSLLNATLDWALANAHAHIAFTVDFKTWPVHARLTCRFANRPADQVDEA